MDELIERSLNANGEIVVSEIAKFKFQILWNTDVDDITQHIGLIFSVSLSRLHFDEMI